MIWNVDPYVLHLGFIHVRWYGLFMAISFALGTYYLYLQGIRHGLEEDFLLNLAVISVVGGLIGARLVFVLANYPQWFISDPWRIVKIYQGGLAWHGGLFGGLGCALGYIWWKKKPLQRLLDWGVPGLSLGYCLVRIGNIFNQEVLGRSTEFWFGNWPAQLVGSAIGLGLLIRYFVVLRKEPPAGYQFWSFLFYHQLLRGLVEETVRDNPLVWPVFVDPEWGIGFFTLAQLATVPILALAGAMMVRTKNRQEPY